MSVMLVLLSLLVWFMRLAMLQLRLAGRGSKIGDLKGGIIESCNRSRVYPKGGGGDGRLR